MFPAWLGLAFVFAFGCCIGSFLNVVIYRLPRYKSLVYPGSACPACGRPIRFYDNIPLVSWLVLGARCRSCKAPISSRYFAIELLTGLVFVGLLAAYYQWDLRADMVPFLAGGWVVYLAHVTLLAALIAASAIDLELWIIPVSICWFVTGAGIACSVFGSYTIPPAILSTSTVLPKASASTGALAAGAAIGMALSLVLLSKGWIKRSYDFDDCPQDPCGDVKGQTGPPQDDPDRPINHRQEAFRECWFLLPIVACSVVAVLVMGQAGPLGPVWDRLVQSPVAGGLLGSVWGYFVGCAVVWLTRILGTLAFGREAMGLGDVHLMGAVGAVLGPWPVVVAFFIAPFFGLGWAAFMMFFKKIRQIPYGPFLSFGTLAVMISHDWIWSKLGILVFVGGCNMDSLAH